MANDQFQFHHPALDGLSDAHVVGNEEVDSGHLNCPHHGIKLIVLDVDAATEGRLDILHVSRRGRTPADGIEKGIEARRIIEARGFGQGNLLNDLRPRFDFPNDL